MVVECIKTFTPNDDKALIFNNDMQGYMQVGDEYVVYGISINKEAIYFMIFREHLIEIPSQLFRVVEGSVSSSWVVRGDANSGLTFYPPLFYEEDFFENFSEREEKERNSFYELQKSFLQLPQNM